MELYGRKVATGRTMCMQLSVDAGRWDAKVLDGLLTRDGVPLSGVNAQLELMKLKADGLEVVPCNRHKCDEKTGRCTGLPRPSMNSERE